MYTYKIPGRNSRMSQYSHPLRNFVPEINYSRNKLGYNSLTLSSNSQLESPSSGPHCTFTNAISLPLSDFILRSVIF